MAKSCRKKLQMKIMGSHICAPALVCWCLMREIALVLGDAEGAFEFHTSNSEWHKEYLTLRTCWARISLYLCAHSEVCLLHLVNEDSSNLGISTVPNWSSSAPQGNSLKTVGMLPSRSGPNLECKVIIPSDNLWGKKTRLDSDPKLIVSRPAIANN